jgi:hypothetical protein
VERTREILLEAYERLRTMTREDPDA